MNRYLAAALTTLMVAGAAACHKSGENANADVANPGQSAPVNTVQDVAAGPTGMVSSVVNSGKAADYVPAAGIADLYEVEAAKIAVQRAKDPKVKAFAEMMIKDHTKSTNDLKAALQSANLPAPPPPVLDERRKGLLDNLRAAGDSDFDLAYLHQQAAAHLEALSLHKGFADRGDTPALKTLAAAVAPVVSKHLDHLKEIGGDKLKDAFPG